MTEGRKEERCVGSGEHLCEKDVKPEKRHMWRSDGLGGVPCENTSHRIPDGIDASLVFAGQILLDYTAPPISSG